ncbi:hypothetical protein PFISCL1PPCAC_23413 [Pristionchus fissidentatus]|uniref:rRNA-processing protein UTP23 homolog n=1 Tax=Pristionchus fissidentatus TaxID=1538716 RepID=A0AAV5WIL3_9BILA|nr:hypothetical protein PFISCL1PPCAC_23413 [Pristionchus fissidentatus]
MKQTRLKRASRILSVYRYNFGVTPPYQVIIDGTYAQAALTEKLNLSEQLPKYLGAPVEIYTTKCCLDELAKLGRPLNGALCIAKLQQVADCPHNPPRGAGDCLAHLARRMKKDKKKKFIFGTQDPTLSEKLRAIGGIPLLYIAYKTVLLDPVSDATKKEMESSAPELETLKELKKELLGEAPVKKKRKQKGVNPLSCKKKVMKKPAKTVEGTKTANGKRRRRKKGGEGGAEGGGGGEKMES